MEHRVRRYLDELLLLLALGAVHPGTGRVTVRSVCSVVVTLKMGMYFIDFR
jgi:hypothetical protein